MPFVQRATEVLPVRFLESKQLTQVVESTYNRRVLRYAYHATAKGEYLPPCPPEPNGSTELFPCCDCS
jgi:hypothetical protein